MDRDSQDRHEIAVGVRHNEEENRRRHGSLIDNRPLYGPHLIPDNDYEALMECAPFQEPKVSMETIVAEEDFGDIMFRSANLTDKEIAVMQMVVYGEMTLEATGVMLGQQFRASARPFSKRGVSLLRDSALRKLRFIYVTE